MAPKRKPNEYYVENDVAHVKLKHTDNEMLCDATDWDRLREITWFYDGGYAKARHRGKTLKIHRYIMNPPADMEVDHINHNPLDNRRENLRIVSHVVNMANRGRQSNNKTGTNGVYFNKRLKRYYAQINVNGQRKHLGCFKTLEEAVKVRLEAEEKYLKPFIEQGTVKI